MKKIKFNLPAIIGMMVAVGTVAFTVPTQNYTLAPEWYEVTPHPGNSDLDEIGSITSDPTQAGTCDTENDFDRCAIRLDLSNASQMPATVKEAKEDPSVLVYESTFSDEQ